MKKIFSLVIFLLLLSTTVLAEPNYNQPLTPSPLPTSAPARPDLNAAWQELQERYGQGWNTEKDDPNKAVTATTTCMLGAGCKMNVSRMLGLRPGRSEEDRTSVLTFVQDAVLAVTMFIGTVVTVAFVLSGLLFVFTATNTGLKTKAKQGMVNAAIGMILVAASYAIIRLIQFIARG